MTVSGKVALENIQNEVHNTEANKFSCVMSPAPILIIIRPFLGRARVRAQGAHGSHGPGPGPCCRHLPMSLARAHNMGLDSSGKGILLRRQKKTF